MNVVNINKNKKTPYIFFSDSSLIAGHVSGIDLMDKNSVEEKMGQVISDIMDHGEHLIFKGKPFFLKVFDEKYSVFAKIRILELSDEDYVKKTGKDPSEKSGSYQEVELDVKGVLGGKNGYFCPDFKKTFNKF